MKPIRHALLVTGIVLLLVSSAASVVVGFGRGAVLAPAASTTPAHRPVPVATRSLPARSGGDPEPVSRMATTASGIVGTASAAPPPIPGMSSPLVTTGWDALHYGTNDNLSNGWVPPDVQVAAGPDHVVEMVNLLIGVYTKAGTQVSVVALASLFNSGSDFISDPKVQYDLPSARWFASVTDVTTGQVLLIVSTSTDPTLAWRHYAVPSARTSQCLDQPIIGVGTTTVIVSVNVFSSCTSPSFTYVGAQYFVVNKTNLLAGASPAVFASVADANEESIHPAQIQGPSDAHFMASTYWPGTATTSSALHLFTVSGTPPAAVTVTVTTLAMPTAAVPPAATQQGSGHTIDTSDIRVADAAWGGGRLWLGFDEACLADPSRACPRLVEIDTGARTILQDFDVDVAGKHVFYPAFRLDGAGNLAVVVGYSSSSDFPGILVTGRLAGDALNTYQAPIVVVPGTGAESPSKCSTTCRYGDYFGAGLDPADPSVVWLAGEMGTNAGWGTHVFGARVKAELTLVYLVRGGGSGYLPPTLAYVLNGTARSTVLSNAVTAVAADPGSAWSVSEILPGSGATEAWPLDASVGAPPSAGLVNASFNETLVYFHVFSAVFSYSVNGSASPPVPSITYTLYGVTVTDSLAPAHSRWADAGTSFAYENPIRGSTSVDRFFSPDPTTGAVLGATDVSVRYYHQFSVGFGFSIVGGGPGYRSPSVTVQDFGSGATLPVPSTAWADAGSTYSYDAVLPGSDASRRWAAGSNATGLIVDASPIVVVYALQYRLSVAVSPLGAAALATASGWYAGGGSVTLAAASNRSWEFHGWIGTGAGAYSGPDANGSITMAGPISETAAYYPGLTIVADPGGSVTYAYGTVSGTVDAGSSATIFVAPGTTVSLSATSSSLADSFGGWTGADAVGSRTASVRVDGPRVVAASFGPNLLFVGSALGIVLIAIALVALLLLARRRRKRVPPP